MNQYMCPIGITSDSAEVCSIGSCYTCVLSRQFHYHARAEKAEARVAELEGRANVDAKIITKATNDAASWKRRFERSGVVIAEVAVPRAMLLKWASWFGGDGYLAKSNDYAAEMRRFAGETP